MYSKMLKNDLSTTYGWLGANKKITILRGAYVTPANNLPKGGYFVVVGAHTELCNGDGTCSYASNHKLGDEVRSWARNYGFHVTDDDVTIADAESVDNIETEEDDLEFLDSLCEDGLMP